MFQYVDATPILITSTTRILKSIDAPCRRLVWFRTMFTIIIFWSPTHKHLHVPCNPSCLTGDIPPMPLEKKICQIRMVCDLCSGKRAGSGLADALNPEAKGSEPLSVNDIAPVKYQTRPAHDRCNA